MGKLLVVTQKVDRNDQLLGFFIEWLKRLTWKFDKLTVLCLEKGEYELPSNAEVISLGKDRGSGKLKQLLNFYFLIFNLSKDYDSVFVHMNPIWVVLGGPLWRLMNKKIFFWYTSGGVTLKLKLAEKLADVIFTASKDSFRLPSKKVMITGHGINTELFRPGDKQQKTGNKLKILSVGRISPVKNYETLIEAAKILKNEDIDFSVTMVGEATLETDRSYEEKIKSLIADYQLQDRFSFLGRMSHDKLPEIYRSCDIFIHLSKTGSLDKTILEAMACGMNVLSSNDSSQAFLKNEMIFKEDDPNELVGKIKNLRNVNYGQELRSYVLKNHNLDNLINKISTIING